jgi:hypothetical protein
MSDTALFADCRSQRNRGILPGMADKCGMLQTFNLKTRSILVIKMGFELGERTTPRRVIGRLAIRYRGVELAYRTFDKVRQVSQAAIVENKQLGAALAFIRDQQLRREPEHRSDRAPRRRDQRNARLFKVG